MSHTNTEVGGVDNAVDFSKCPASGAPSKQWSIDLFADSGIILNFIVMKKILWDAQGKIACRIYLINCQSKITGHPVGRKT